MSWSNLLIFYFLRFYSFLQNTLKTIYSNIDLCRYLFKQGWFIKVEQCDRTTKVIISIGTKSYFCHYCKSYSLHFFSTKCKQKKTEQNHEYILGDKDVKYGY